MRRRPWLVLAPVALVSAATAVVAPSLTRPTRPLAYLLGPVGGFVIAFVFAVLFHRRDTTFRTDDDVASALDLPVLAVVPAMRTVMERRRDRRRRLRRSITATALVLAGVAAYIWAAFR